MAAGHEITIYHMNARDLALVWLDRRSLPHWPEGMLHHLPRDSAPADPRDKALSEQIGIGVVKNLMKLQHEMQQISGRSLKSIDPVTQKILAIALYQLGFLNRIPISAAVNEAVEQTRRWNRANASGFVNAVLRKATRQPMPTLPGDADPPTIAELEFSHPRELFDRMNHLLGSENALKLCRHNNSEPPTIVRLLPGATIESLQTPGIEVIPHHQPGFAIAARAPARVLADWYTRGLAQVQDPTSAAVVPMMQIMPGQRVLDRCSGMGTKTLQICELTGDTGSIIAIDASPACRDALNQTAALRGFTNIQAVTGKFMADIPSDIRFDRILIDAPCSNSGVLARRPEARYRQDQRHLSSLHELQLNILNDTADALLPGGLMFYSTCSLWPEENRQAMDQFLSTHPDYHFVEDRLTLPSFDATDPDDYHDGGYVAVLKRVN